jgi:uncharacterized membrane protein
MQFYFLKTHQNVTYQAVANLDNQGLNLKKKKEKNKNKLIKANVSIGFLFCTQDTIEGVSDLGSIAIL